MPVSRRAVKMDLLTRQFSNSEGGHTHADLPCEFTLGFVEFILLRKLFIIIGFTLAFAFAGCSGGGGGGNSGGGASGLTYSGVTTPAQVDQSNVEEITGGAFATGLIGDGMVGLSVDQQIESYHIRNFRSVKVPTVLSDSLNLVDFTSASSGGIQAATQTESDIIEGNCGGTMPYSVSVDDAQGTFNGSFTFSDYCNDGAIINGRTKKSGGAYKKFNRLEYWMK
jgi:hypothetical protein